VPVKKNSRITHGNPYIKGLICECAWSTISQKKTHFAIFYRKIQQRRGGKKAIIALSRKILVVIYHLLKNKEFYDEKKFEITKIRQETMRIKRITHEVNRLGFNLIPI
jgi:hypothetical protein